MKISLRNAMSFVSSVVSQSATIIIPHAFNSLMEMSLQDLRIGKIVGGIGLTVSGMSLIVSSGVPKTLKSWYWTDEQNHNNHSNPLRWGRATAGLMITSYGVYNIATGILELMASEQIDSQTTYDSNFPNQSESTCNSNILKAKEQLLSCPEGKKIWNQVKGGGPFTIKCTTSQEAPTGAKTLFGKREIHLVNSDVNNEENLENLLVELLNLKRSESMLFIGQNTCQFSADKYATAIEAIEYEAAKEVYHVFHSCVKKGFWHSDFPSYQEESDELSDLGWISFEKYLQIQEEHGHTDLYRRNWYKRCDPQGHRRT